MIKFRIYKNKQTKINKLLMIYRRTCKEKLNKNKLFKMNLQKTIKNNKIRYKIHKKILKNNYKILLKKTKMKQIK